MMKLPSYQFGVTGRAPEYPATNNGGLKAGRYPGGTAGEEQESTYIGNPDIQIPVVQKPVERLRQEKETEQEDAEAGERQSEETHEERSSPEQLTHKGNLDGGQGSPEMRRLRHVPGGAWLQQIGVWLEALSF
ncbi:hypothetical protein NDU88_000028 [Pleurodeles waltl]|uniref:Uncharacterized protein n=1 Tax=Pleurodeles waltl TaxID=8319 RepID=A0AAV7VV94_PLEWA|nr:hypothetical protein NDU88_000028 [Pleurodeles waltl]